MSTSLKSYINDFKQLNSTDCFSENRRAAWALFEEQGFPSSKREEWKYTNVRPISKQEFSSINNQAVPINSDRLAKLNFKATGCIELVFINGVFSKDYSNSEVLPKGLVVETIQQAIANNTQAAAEHLTQYADSKVNPFIALNTAFIKNGVLIHVLENAVIDQPINIVYLSAKSSHAIAIHPRNLLVMAKHSAATIIENYIGLDDENYFTNTVTEATLSEGAKVNHYKVQQENSNAYHIGSLSVHQQKDSEFESYSISLGGALVRNDIYAKLAADGATIAMHGLYLTHGKQHVDNHTQVDHLKSHTHSSQNYRGVLDQHGKAVFNGKVVVHPQAQKIVALQNNANLLLAEDAEVNTKPDLEIYADDVQCSHGATVGQIDEKMLFYLCSRGIDEATARSLLAYAFSFEIIKNINFATMQNWLQQLVIEQLSSTQLVQLFDTQ